VTSPTRSRKKKRAAPAAKARTGSARAKPRAAAPRDGAAPALRELRDQTERLRLAQKTAGMIVMDWDIANDRIAWSDSPVWLRGPLPDSGRYPVYREQVHPEDRGRFLETRRRAIETGEGQSIEYRVVRTDGAVRWIQTHQVVTARARGRATRMLVAMHDITARKEAEQRARAADERIGVAVEALAESIAITDAEDRIVVANRHFRELNGNTRLVEPGHRYEEHIRAGLSLGNYPDAIGREDAWLRERLAARRRGGTIEVARQDGRWLRVTDQPLPGGGVLTFALDITQAKRAAQALLESEARFRAFAESSSDWMWETDAENRYTWFGGAIERSVGRPSAYYLGRDRFEVARAAGADLEAEPWRSHRELIARREPFRDFLHRRVIDTGELWLSLSGTPRFDAAGRFLGYRATVSDVTARIRAEQALQQSEARFRDFAAASGDWFWELDAQDRYTWVSAPVRSRIDGSVLDMVGMTRAESAVATGVDREHGDWQAILEAMARREPFRNLRYRIVSTRGTERWIASSGVPRFDARGNYLGYRGTVSNVTPAVLAEQRARESDERLRAAIENLSESVTMTDAEDRIVLANRAFRELNGYAEFREGSMTYLEHLRRTIAAGLVPAANGREEAWIAERMALRRRGGSFEGLRGDGHWLLVTEQPLAQGGWITFALDISERKRAEAVVRESEARFRDLAESSGDWFWETDADDRFTWVSDSIERFTGRPADAFIGKTRAEVALQAGADLESEGWKEVSRSIERREPMRRVRTRRRAPDGTVRWFEASAVPRVDGAGRFLGFRGAVTDVTARVESDKRAREADERLRGAIDALEESISVTDAEDRIVIANDAFLRNSGFDVATLAGKPPYAGFLRDLVTRGEIVAARGREEEWLRARLEARRRGGSLEIRRADGRWLHLVEQRLPGGGMITFARDITERKRAEEALRESEARFRALVELSSDWYWQTDAAHRFTTRAGEVLERMGLPPAADTGRVRWELDYPNMSAADWEAHRAVLERREEFRGLLLQRRSPDGRLHWATISGRPTFDAAGEFTGYHGIGRDVTAQIEAEQALRKLNAELELRVAERTAELRAAYQELESFSYSVSHDLRAPLRAISGFASLLREEESAKLSEKGLRWLGVVDANAQQMGRLVDALLELVRMSRQAIIGTRLDMATLAREVAAELGAEYPGSRIEVGPLPAATGDATLVRQVFVNLVGNALKYSAQAAAPRVDVGAEEGIDGPVFFVRDNGVGFDMAYADKLFKPFERLHADTEYKGTGIGLALAGLIVRRHGGRISAQSAPGKGATFRFTLA